MLEWHLYYREATQGISAPAVGAMERDVLSNIDQLRTFLILLSLVLIVVGLVAGVVIARRIARPLQEVQTIIEAVAEGDLTNTKRSTGPCS